ncbi:uncharacterized protein LOC142616262 [Castanea sativa]|uniref:uncharacterized protein LOC142616262 n=1 Tax=Castanea sativa TaxID=21020 RepID=UPI003F64FA93
METGAEEGSQSNLDKQIWKSIWSLDVPNKYKNLLWRACRESLPTKSNLTRKAIIPTPTYDRCASMAEDTLHSLWGCSGLNVVWDDDRRSFRLREVFADFKHLCGWLMENGKPLELFAVQVWCIWHQRNQSRLQHPCCLTKDLKQAAHERWDEIRSVNPLPNPIRPQPKPKWKAPPLNKYKIKYDGAISNADYKAGIGMVVRDCNGEVMASLIQQLEQAYQPVEVEAIAACKAVEFGSEIGVDCAIVEGFRSDSEGFEEH